MIEQKSGENNYEKYLDNLKYLNITAEEINKMTAEQLGVAAIELSQSALYIQRIINKENSSIQRNKKLIDWMIIGRLNQQSAFHRDDKRLMAIKESQKATDTYIETQKAEKRVSELLYISSFINNLADKFMELQKTVRSRKNG